MHKLVLGIEDNNIFVDHRNHNGLHNFKSNLRIATPSQNSSNRRSRINSSSQYLGVWWNKRKFIWVAEIRKNGNKKHLGSFKNEEDAARAYDALAKELHGEFANLNFKIA